MVSLVRVLLTLLEQTVTTIQVNRVLLVANNR